MALLTLIGFACWVFMPTIAIGDIEEIEETIGKAGLLLLLD